MENTFVGPGDQTGRPYISHCPQSGEGLGGRDTGGRGGGYRNKKRILAHPDFPLRAR